MHAGTLPSGATRTPRDAPHPARVRSVAPDCAFPGKHRAVGAARAGLTVPAAMWWREVRPHTGPRRPTRGFPDQQDMPLRRRPPAGAAGSHHPCGRSRGHNCVVAPALSADDEGLDKVGFVRGWGELADFGKWLDNDVGRRHPDDVLRDRLARRTVRGRTGRTLIHDTPPRSTPTACRPAHRGGRSDRTVSLSRPATVRTSSSVSPGCSGKHSVSSAARSETGRRGTGP